MTTKTICVFCGSSKGVPDKYKELAHDFGKQSALRGIRIIYGGGSKGLMGALADGAIAAGGEVIGVMAKPVEPYETIHSGLATCHHTATMHERKQLMMALSEGFVTLPGGVGTMDEFFEALTLCHIGSLKKPSAILNAYGFYDHLLAFMDKARAEQFIRQQKEHALIIADEVSELLDQLP